MDLLPAARAERYSRNSRNYWLECRARAVRSPRVGYHVLAMSRQTRNLYQWKTRTDDGEKREVEAQLFGTRWTFRSRPSSRRSDEDADWEDHGKPRLEDLQELESMIFNKYQRKHASYDQLESVRKLIADWTPGVR